MQSACIADVTSPKSQIDQVRTYLSQKNIGRETISCRTEIEPVVRFREDFVTTP